MKTIWKDRKNHGKNRANTLHCITGILLPGDTADKRIRLAHRSSKVIMARETSHYTRRRINRDSRTHYYSINRSYRAQPKTTTAKWKSSCNRRIPILLFPFFYLLLFRFFERCRSLPKSLCFVHGCERVNFSIEINDQLDGENVI